MDEKEIEKSIEEASTSYVRSKLRNLLEQKLSLERLLKIKEDEIKNFDQEKTRDEFYIEFYKNH